MFRVISVLLPNHGMPLEQAKMPSPELQNLEQYSGLVNAEAQKQNFSNTILEEIKFKINDMTQNCEVENDISNMLYYPNVFLTLYQIITEIYDELVDDYEKTIENKRLLNEIRMWYIKIGSYKGYTKDELANILSSGKKYEFKQNGLYYDFVKHPEGFNV